MSKFLKLVQAMERIPESLNRIADAGFAIAEALRPVEEIRELGPEDDEGHSLDRPPPGKGMGMGG